MNGRYKMIFFLLRKKNKSSLNLLENFRLPVRIIFIIRMELENKHKKVKHDYRVY